MPQDYIDSQIGERAKEIDRWPTNFRGSKRYDNKLQDKTVILIDDSIATGAIS
jgi:predicted phosphoribosyltransferase